MHARTRPHARTRAHSRALGVHAWRANARAIMQSARLPVFRIRMAVIPGTEYAHDVWPHSPCLVRDGDAASIAKVAGCGSCRRCSDICLDTSLYLWHRHRTHCVLCRRLAATFPCMASAALLGAQTCAPESYRVGLAVLQRAKPPPPSPPCFTTSRFPATDVHTEFIEPEALNSGYLNVVLKS